MVVVVVEVVVGGEEEEEGEEEDEEEDVLYFQRMAMRGIRPAPASRSLLRVLFLRDGALAPLVILPS